MYRNNVEIARHLDAGGTLVVPTRQRAAAVRLAHTAEQVAGGRRLWKSPEIIPWQAWVNAQRSLSPVSNRATMRVLTPFEQWLIWREVVREQAAATGVLLPDSLINPVRRAALTMEEWGLSAGSGTEEGMLLSSCRREFQRRCASLGAAHDLWQPTADSLPSSTWFAGFGNWPAVVRRNLEARGARLDEPVGTGVVPVTRASSAAFEHADAELECMAAWCRTRLQHSPATRLLVVVPNLSRIEARVRRALTHALAGAEAMNGQSTEALFAIEGGIDLDSYPMVSAALWLLGLAAGELEFDAAAALLRSPYLDFGSVDVRIGLELALRDDNATRIGLPLPRAAGARAGRRGDLALDQTVAQLLKALELPDGLRQTPSWWARRYAAMLKACGWPGVSPLASTELQVRQRFDELLGEFAALDEVAGRLDCRAAVEVLADWVAQTALEPASDDVAVTVTASLQDPLAEYDGIWVSGLTADVWPQPPQPDPLLLVGLQRSAGIEAASAIGQLAAAQRAMRAWARCSAELICSWSRLQEEAECEPSPLLAHLPAWSAVTTSPPFSSALAAEMLEKRAAPAALPWERGRRIPGGVRVFQLQAACPFRASAELRLSCAPLEEPQAGIDARTHGIILHRALERIWRQLGDHGGLQRRNPSAIEVLVADCVRRAIDDVCADLLAPPPAPLVRIEARRAEQLLSALLAVERGRAAFAIEALEWRQILQFAGMPVDLRLDRIDRLTDGSLAVIDYKSGAPERFDPLAAKPAHAQLLAYSVAAGRKVAAVAAVHLQAQGIRWRGLADAADRLPNVPPASDQGLDWEGLRIQWQQQIEGLATRFGAGEAAVAPQPGACRYCHLQLLCRVDAVVEAMAVEAEDDG